MTSTTTTTTKKDHKKNKHLSLKPLKKAFFKIFGPTPKPVPVFRIVEDEKGNKVTYVGDYELTNQILGHGGTAVVNIGVDVRTSKKVAIKCLPYNPRKLQSMIQPDGSLNLLEAKIMKQLLHPNLTRLLDIYHTETYVYLVQELVEGKELFDLIQSERKTGLSEERIFKIFSQIVSVVQYLHVSNVIHNDLKVENMLVDENDHITLLDFGHSFLASGEGQDSKFPGISTLEYTAPETLLYSQCTTESEVWSLGVILFVLVYGRIPFDGHHFLMRQLISEAKYTFPTKRVVSEECRDLISKMLVLEPKDRLTLDGIKSHPWMFEKMQHYNRSELEAQ